MESLAYLSKAEIELEDIEQVANGIDYEAYKFTIALGGQEHEQLNIHPYQGSKDYCYFYKAEEAALLLDEDGIARLQSIEYKSIFVVDFRYSMKDALIILCQELLKKFGGVFDSKGELLHLYNLTNITKLFD
jgi:hypothetical protein